MVVGEDQILLILPTSFIKFLPRSPSKCLYNEGLRAKEECPFWDQLFAWGRIQTSF